MLISSIFTPQPSQASTPPPQQNEQPAQAQQSGAETGETRAGNRVEQSSEAKETSQTTDTSAPRESGTSSSSQPTSAPEPQQPAQYAAPTLNGPVADESLVVSEAQVAADAPAETSEGLSESQLREYAKQGVEERKFDGGASVVDLFTGEAGGVSAAPTDGSSLLSEAAETYSKFNEAEPELETA